MGAVVSARAQWGVGLFVLWVAARVGLLGSAVTRVRITGFEVTGVGDYLFIDLSWLPFAAAAALLVQNPPSDLGARLCLALMGVAQAFSFASTNLARYYAGNALAWDLANFVQPMWRAAHGASMAATWSGNHPVWGDHGSFAFYVFAPLARLGSDPATFLIITQGLITAAFAPALYALGRKLDLSIGVALIVSAASTSSRALANAAAFDFHPECALPLLLALLCLLESTGRIRAFFAVACLAVCLKDGAAMVVAMTAGWLGVRTLRLKVLAVAAFAGSVACFDVLLLPRLTGWPSYLAMNASASVDLSIAATSTFGRALSQGVLGWLHPIAWVGGAPWALAAGLSPKLAVKSIAFQYGFLWVPVGAIGTVFLLRWLRSRASLALVWAWATLTMCVNAPLPADTDLFSLHDGFKTLRAELSETVGQGAVATDACTAPWIMDRMELFGLCQLDVGALTRGQGEGWTLPSRDAWKADTVVIDKSCAVHGACLERQLAELGARGYALHRVVRDRWGVFTRAPR